MTAKHNLEVLGHSAKSECHSKNSGGPLQCLVVRATVLEQKLKILSLSMIPGTHLLRPWNLWHEKSVFCMLMG